MVNSTHRFGRTMALFITYNIIVSSILLTHVLGLSCEAEVPLGTSITNIPRVNHVIVCIYINNYNHKLLLIL